MLKETRTRGCETSFISSHQASLRRSVELTLCITFACCLQKLEKAKEKWHASAKERAKKREADRKAKLYEEQAKDRAKAAAEEEVIR